MFQAAQQRETDLAEFKKQLEEAESSLQEVQAKLLSRDSQMETLERSLAQIEQLGDATSDEGTLLNRAMWGCV
jgi:chromosome segregation ATPase